MKNIKKSYGLARQYILPVFVIFLILLPWSRQHPQESKEKPKDIFEQFTDQLEVLGEDLKSLDKEFKKMEEDIKKQDFKFIVRKTEILKAKLEKITGLIKPREEEGEKEPPPPPPPHRLLGKCDPEAPSFDWREHGVISEIKHQRSCGSCYIFSATALYESSLSLYHNVNADVSEQEFLDCHKKYTCNGGWPSSVLRDMSHKPIHNEKSYPYKAYSGECKLKTKGVFYTTQSGSLRTPPEQILHSPEAIKKAICHYGAVVTTIQATRMFQAYGGGVFDEHPKLTRYQVNHAINLIGWDDSKKAWLIKNSWGAKWGKKGYGWVEYGSNNIGSDIIWTIAKKVEAAKKKKANKKNKNLKTGRRAAF